MAKDKDYNQAAKKAEDVSKDAEYQAILARAEAARKKAAAANAERAKQAAKDNK